jgi:hypothetical protein
MVTNQSYGKQQPEENALTIFNKVYGSNELDIMRFCFCFHSSLNQFDNLFFCSVDNFAEECNNV